MRQAKDIILGEKIRINEYISSIFQDYKKNLGGTNRFAGDTLEKLENFSLKGKGIRGGLLIISACMFGYEDTKTTLELAAAIEILHSSLLIHDDIMDNDLLRRGNPSIYSQYVPRGENIGSPDPMHYAESLGMCVGDVGFFVGFDICTRIMSHNAIDPKILSTLCQEFTLVGFAQMHDVHLANNPEIPEFEEIMEVYRLKTARYTFSLPLRLGAMLAGQDENVLMRLDLLGEHVGIIFQMRDDEIGLFSTEEEIGKPIGSDLRENKKTLIRALLSTDLPKEKLSEIEQITFKGQITREDLTIIKKYMQEYGIEEKLSKMLQSHKNAARDILSQLPISKEFAPTLIDLIEFVATRKS